MGEPPRAHADVHAVNNERGPFMKGTFNTVLYAVALALGVAVVVLNIINPLSAGTTSTLLGIGLFCLGLAGIR